MPSTNAPWSARSAWAFVVLALAGAAACLLVPALRPTTAVVAVCASALLTLAGTLVHRPRGAAWPLLVLMMAVWAAGVVLVGHRGHLDTTSTLLVWAGQAAAVTVTVHVARSGRADGRCRETASATRLDLVVIGAVLALAAAQLLAVLAAGGGDVTGVVVATVDVALLGVLLRFALTRRGLPPSSWLLLLAACLTVAYDLGSALQGRRLALPGEPEQALGVLCLALPAAAALHPSMVLAFSERTFARRRRPSGALLGMLPLVLVPGGTWWVAQTAGVPGLPGWAFPATGALIAGLCLLRAAQALRTSEHLAEHDPLTDLANRRGLARAFEERDERTAHSLLLVDLDQFKQVNDTHGHDAGDALLLQVRDRFLAATGRRGLLARLGGDEFVVLTPASGARPVADALLHALAAPVVLDHLVLRVGASIGIAHEDGTQGGTGTPGPARLADLLTHADVAMYTAKGSGGGRAVVFRPEMRSAVAHRYTLGGEIRQLLAGRAHEVGALEIHYQPLVDLASGGCVGAEALVRWRHPRQGLLAPDRFLDLVTDNDLDVALDAAVLEEVLDQVVRWREEGRALLPVSVNLTPDSLREPDLADRVLAALARARVAPSLLHLEITEHERLHEDGPATRTLGLLDDAGVHVHLDDYGTGWTSLDYLSRFPVRLLKLDRSVVAASSDHDAPLVAGVQAMADALDLDVLAEGVETAAQREQLLRLGVRYGQGYLFSRPLPAREFADAFLPRPATATSQHLPTG
ncbi:putative bifunctional diguanylate cyclase/phosphodiesterase [Kineococcus sp. LSe6-4]|uniref:Bifunctional diguanylate cyclase/phosphodiesterase n=1 Tax=Kineococcus halophytocola TaxID=3234027 RepID=A0ABV4GVS4_9ACTN